jgi:hypothetical protein
MVSVVNIKPTCNTLAAIPETNATPRIGNIIPKNARSKRMNNPDISSWFRPLLAIIIDCVLKSSVKTSLSCSTNDGHIR